MIIYKADDTQRAEVAAASSSLLKHTLLGQHKVDLNFTLETWVPFALGDYILFKGDTYTIQKQPVVKKNKTNEYQYSLEFFAHQYVYDHALFMLNGETDFVLRGDIETFMQLVVDNMNRVATGTPYSLGAFPTTQYKDLAFNGESCLAALQKVCKEFDMEYKLASNGFQVVTGSDLGNATALAFEFKAGLRNIQRQQLNEGVFVTRLYPYGAERNTQPGTYGSKRLKLPSVGFPNGYMEANVANFGVVEKHKIFEEIYPRREGTITAVDAGDELKFTDTGMDFDINAQLIPGKVAKITFNSGLLVGYEFEILSYNNTTKEFTLISIQNDQDVTLPNTTQRPALGDNYVIHDIIMPGSYITAAETELQTAAQAFLDAYSSPNVVYTITPDPVHFETNVISLNAGDIIQITDTDFGITIDTKIIELTQSVANPYLYTIKVGAKATVTYLTRVLDGVNANSDQITLDFVDRTVERLRIANRLKDLQSVTDAVFDVDGYFDATKIKPLSIETSALAVGAKPLNMQFIDLEIKLNLNGVPNQYDISAAEMVHFTIEDTPRSWNITSVAGTIADNNARYLYCQVASAAGQTGGTWVIDTAQRMIDHTPGQYTFLVGIIHPVRDSARGVSMLYGQTFINGRFITTGRIQSINQLNYFDLDTNQFKLGDGSSSIDWNVTNPNKLTIKGGIIQSESGDEFPAMIYRGDYDNAVTYYKGDSVTYNGTTYLYYNDTAKSGQVPPNNADDWKVVAQAGSDGSDGADGVPGVDGADGVTYYTWIKYADDVNGNGLSNSPLGKEYIGVAYNKTTATESTNPADYEWSLFKGDQGIPGVDGADGTPRYTWLKYADSPTTGMSDNPSGKQYLGLAHNKTTATESSNYSDYSWSPIKGETGDQGVPGVDGAPGADGQDGANGINGTDGLDGADALDALVGDYDPALVGGESDMEIFLDTTSGGTVNAGEIRVLVSKIIDPNGLVVYNKPSKQEAHILSSFGEGSAGIFFLVYTQTSVHSRFGSSSNYINNNFMIIYWDGSNYRHCENLTPNGDVVTLVGTDIFLAAIEARKTTGGLTRCKIFYKGGIAMDSFNPDVETYSFSNIKNDIDFRKEWYIYSGGGETSFPSSGQAGDRVLQCGNNSGNDMVWAETRRSYPLDPNALYKIEARVRRTNGSGTFYVGVNGVDANGDWVNTSGADSGSSQHYIAASSVSPGSTGWSVYEGYFRGVGTSSVGGYHPSIDDPAIVHSSAKYFRLMFLCNYNGQAGTTQFDYIKLTRMESTPSFVNGAAWSSSPSYPVGSMVEYAGITWRAIRRGSNKKPTSNIDTYWAIVSYNHAYNFRGDFKAANYYWTDEVRDIVKYNGNYYRYNKWNDGSSSVESTWISGNWELFGSQFSMVATDTLLADNAFIADWVVKDGHITSQAMSGSNPKVTLDGLNGNAMFRDTNTHWWGTSELQFEIDVDSGWIRILGSANGQSNGTNLYFDLDGAIFQAPGNSSFINNSSISSVYSPLICDLRNADSSKYSAGIVGLRVDSHEKSWGGMIEGLVTDGLAVGNVATSSNRTLNNQEMFVRHWGSTSRTIYLPPNPINGQMHIILRSGSGGCTVNGNGRTIVKGGSNLTSDTIGTRGRASMFVYQSGNWWLMYIGL